MIRILVADKQTIFREGLSNLLAREPDFEVVAGAGDGQETLKLAAELKPDVLLLDFSMPMYSALQFYSQAAGCRRGEPRSRAGDRAGEGLDQRGVPSGSARSRARGSRATEVLVQAIRGVMQNMYWNVDQGVSDLRALLRGLAEPGVKETPLKTFGLYAAGTGDRLGDRVGPFEPADRTADVHQ